MGSKRSSRSAATFAEVLGAVLARRREGQGKTQGALASELRLSQATLSRLERGRTTLSVPQLRTAAHSLGVQVSQLLVEAEVGAAALSRRGVSVLDREPASEQRARFMRVAPKEIEVAVALAAGRLKSRRPQPRPGPR